MAVTITIDGTPGVALDVASGVALLLAEQGGFANVYVAQWSLTTPPGSIAALSTPGAIGSPPFTNGFTPDVPGDYRVRLVVTYANGTTAEDSTIVSVALPYATGGEILPAPSETTERNADTGWADGAALALKVALDTRSGAEWVGVWNPSGTPIAAGTLTWAFVLQRWAELTGGSQVNGTPADYVLSVEQTPYGFPVFCPEAIGENERGRALRRGMIPFDASTFGVVTNGALYFDGTTGLTTTPGPIRCGFGAAGADDIAQPGWLLFDPADLLGNRYRTAVLYDNQAVATPVIYQAGVGGDLTYDLADVVGFSLRYRITRGSGRTQVGRIIVAGEASGPSASIVSTLAAPVSSGIVFSADVNAGNLRLLYTSTSVGVNGAMTYIIEEVWRA